MTELPASTIMSDQDEGRRRAISIGAILVHIVGIGLILGIVFPMTSLSMVAWGESETLIGFAGAASPLGILLALPFIPRVARRLKAVPTMVIGCLIALASVTLMWAVPDGVIWVIARFIMGVGLAMPWLVSDVWINTVAPENSRGKIIAAYVTSLFIGLALGPFALDAVGLAGDAPFLLVGGAILVAIMPLILAAKVAPAVEPATGGTTFAPIVAAPLIAIGSVLAGATEGASFSLLPVWASSFGATEGEALRLFIVFMIGGIFSQFAIGILADRMPRELVLSIVGAGLLIAALGLQFAPFGWATSASSFLAGATTLGLYGLSLTLLGQRFEPAQLAGASAAFLIVYQLGSITGPAMTGAAMSTFTPSAFPIALAISGTLVCIAALRSFARNCRAPTTK